MTLSGTFSRSCLALAISQALIAPAHAATLTVDSHLDDGTGCTLREAIVSINSEALEAGCGIDSGSFGTNDTIYFGNLASSTIVLAGGQLSIAFDKNITINGGDIGLTINGGGNRVFNLDLSTLTLTNATITGGSASQSGGGIYANRSNVSLNNCIVTGNYASDFGGGIYADQSNVSLSNSVVTSNRAEMGGGIDVRESGSITLNNSTVSANTSAAGGGIHVLLDSSLSLVDSTVSTNVAGRGGGIHSVTGSVTLVNSTVSGNSANGESDDSFPGNGGGIYALGATLSLANSTVSGNTARLTGGGINAGGGGSMSMSNSTVSGNSANFGGGIHIQSSSASLSNSIISGNDAIYGAKDIFGGDYSITTNNANLFGDSSSTSAEAFIGFIPGISDIQATSDASNVALASILSPLTNNGGPTQTHALVTASPALDVADNSDCGPGKTIDADQRGEPRNDGLCDIGSFESITFCTFPVDLPPGFEAGECSGDPLPSGDTCTAQCAAGYRPIGSTVVGCFQGSFVPPEGQCVVLIEEVFQDGFENGIE